MNKVYLTSVLPDSAAVAKNASPDLFNLMQNYKQEKETYRNVAPDIRPQPLEKYEINKSKEERVDKSDEVEDAEETDNLEESDDVTVDMSAAIARLPKNYQAKGRKLLPYMFRVDWQGQPLDGLLYDLLVPSKHFLTPPPILQVVISQLNRLKDLPSSYYINKLDINKKDGAPITARVRLAHPIAASTPKRAPQPPGRASSPVFFTPTRSSSILRDNWL